MKQKTRRTDATAVHDAAARLDVSEFEIFRRAHRAWFGRDGNEKSLERVFVAYMFHGRVPSWVRHHCRDAAAAARSTDAQAAALPASDLEQRRHVITLAVAVTAAVFFMTMGSGGTAPGCPGAHVEMTPTATDTVSRPAC